MKFERDALKLEKEKLRAKIKDADLLEKELNAAKLHGINIKKLKTQWAAGNGEASWGRCRWPKTRRRGAPR
jgi:hypothetical protein